MGECRICRPPEPVPDRALLDHLRVLHPDQWAELAAWPDGSLVLEEPDADPGDCPTPPPRR